MYGACAYYLIPSMSKAIIQKTMKPSYELWYLLNFEKFSSTLRCAYYVILKNQTSNYIESDFNACSTLLCDR